MGLGDANRKVDVVSKRLKIVVDRDLCDAHGRCVEAAPAVFAIGDDDQMHLLSEHPDESERANVEKAVQRCPKGALTLIVE